MLILIAHLVMRYAILLVQGPMFEFVLKTLKQIIFIGKKCYIYHNNQILKIKKSLFKNDSNSLVFPKNFLK